MNFRLELDQSDFDRLTRGFELAVAAQSSRTLEHLGDVAVRSLSQLDAALGHPRLADLWTHTPALPDEDGGLMVTVFSEAETMRFYNMTSSKEGRVKSDRHFIEGEALLEILEGGAQEHEIAAVEALTLAFPDRTGRTVFPLVVEHPGVQANENMKQTAELIEEGLEAVGEDAARAISVELY